jgi:single-stranded-DNA-specific exonuclease
VPDYDAELTLADVTNSTLRDIEKLAPFGMSNKKPLFVFKDCFVDSAAPFGKEKQHTKLTLSSSVDDRATISAIQFFSSAELKDIKAGETDFACRHTRTRCVCARDAGEIADRFETHA